MGDNGRFSKDDMLSIFVNQKEHSALDANIDRIFSGAWDLDAPDNVSSTAKDPGPEVCWLNEPRFDPLGMRDMDDSERQVRSSVYLFRFLLIFLSFSLLRSIHQ